MRFTMLQSMLAVLLIGVVLGGATCPTYAKRVYGRTLYDRPYPFGYESWTEWGFGPPNWLEILLRVGIAVPILLIGWYAMSRGKFSQWKFRLLYGLVAICGIAGWLLPGMAIGFCFEVLNS